MNNKLLFKNIFKNKILFILISFFILNINFSFALTDTEYQKLEEQRMAEKKTWKTDAQIQAGYENFIGQDCGAKYFKKENYNNLICDSTGKIAVSEKPTNSPANTTVNGKDTTLTNYQLLQPYRPSQDSEIKTSYNVEKTGLSSYIAEISRYIYIVIAIIAAFYLVYGGIQYLTTDMNSLKQEGKATIKRVLTGLIFIFSIWTIFNAINPNFLKTNIDFSAYKIPEGMGIDKTTYEAMDFTASAPSVSISSTNTGSSNSGGSFANWPTGPQPNGCNGGSATRANDTINCLDIYKSDIESSAKNYNLDPNLIRTIIWIESSGGANRGKSSAGAYGIMQLLPATAKALNCNTGWDSASGSATAGIDCGSRYLRDAKAKGFSDADIFASYNGGTGPNAMDPSSDCKDLRRWQCAYDNPEHTKCNTGFVEARNYAMNGLNWLPKLQAMCK